ncbi:MAG: hypothetical protein FWD59_00965 [Micrococcales bacterium]|nr:hypothetical protein [Micrococcales bacterium]
MRRILPTVLSLLLLTGCASVSGESPESPTLDTTTTQPGEDSPDPMPPDNEAPLDVDPPAVDDAPGSDPIGLVNIWRVSTDSEEPDTWLRLDHFSYQLWRTCGFLEGGWYADDQSFFASEPHSWSGACGKDGESQTAPWLSSIASYEPTEDGWRLMAADGAELATLTVDGAPPPDRNSADFFREPPEITDELRDWLAKPVPLPDGLEPATAEQLLGRWVPVEQFTTEPFLTFNADGTWEGSDGCNGSGGAWRLVGDEGKIFSTSGIETLIGCEGVSTSYWLYRSTRAGLDNGTLVLLDQHAEELGRLTRS